MIRPLLFALGFSVVSVTTQAAQVIFTFSGFVTSSTVLGYEVNDPITVTYVSSGEMVTTTTGGLYQWYEEETTDPTVFTTVSLSGASGTWVRPGSSVLAPESVLVLVDNSDDDIAVLAAADVPDDADARTGLTVGSVPVVVLLTQAQVDNSPFVFDTASLSVSDYFSGYEGSYTLIPYADSPSYIELLDGQKINFSATSLTIVVPEPSAALVLLGSAGFFLCRRRRVA